MEKEVNNDLVFCKRCGKPLIGEKSRERGWGPTCYKLWKLERAQSKKLFDVEDVSHE